MLKKVVGDLAAVGSFTLPGVRGAPPSPLNVPIGPHRRFAWSDADLARVKAIKDALGGTVNDVVLATVAGGLGRYLRAHGHPTIDLVLRAMIPVSVRADAERGALGNQVAAVWAGLPVGVTDPVERLELIKREMEGLKESGQAVGARVLTELTGFAPPTVMAQAARLQAHQRFFNLVVTNVPGPQLPLYVLGRRMRGDLPDGAAGAEPGARDRDHELRRRGSRSASTPTSTRCPTSSCSPASSPTRSTSWPTPPGCRRSPPRADAAPPGRRRRERVPQTLRPAAPPSRFRGG